MGERVFVVLPYNESSSIDLEQASARFETYAEAQAFIEREFGDGARRYRFFSYDRDTLGDMESYYDFDDASFWR